MACGSLILSWKLQPFGNRVASGNESRPFGRSFNATIRHPHVISPIAIAPRALRGNYI